MKKLLTLMGVIVLLQAKAQTIESVDSLRERVLKNLDQYESLQYSNEVISNEDAMRYDSACFYYDQKGQLVYINWRERSHTFHIAGDGISIIELFFLNGKVVFQSDFFYQFLNPQWQREPDLNETIVRVIESTRRYYKEDGSAIMDYESRKAEGKYKDRSALLDNVPLEEVERLIWTDRCDECIEEEYLSVYRKLLAGKGKK